jgi:arylformamidase
MNLKLITSLVLPLLVVCNTVRAQQLKSDIPYVENGHERQVLDVYTPERAADGRLPVMFWIHGGGWEGGDKSEVALKPKALTRGDLSSSRRTTVSCPAWK